MHEFFEKKEMEIKINSDLSRIFEEFSNLFSQFYHWYYIFSIIFLF